MTGIHVPGSSTDRSTPSSEMSAGCRATRPFGAWPSRPSRTARQFPGAACILILLLLAGVAACGGAETSMAVPSEAGTPVATGDGPTGLAVHEEVLLVTHGSGAVVRVTADGGVERLAEAPDRLAGPVVAFESLWAVQTGAGGSDVTEGADGSIIDYRLDGVVRIDPSAGTTLAMIDDLGAELLLAATEDALWVAGERAGEQGWVWRIDPGSDSATVVQAGDGVRGDLAVRVNVLIAVGNQLWLAGNCEAMPCPAGAARVRIVDPATGEVAPLAVALPDDLMLSDAVTFDGRVWFAGLSLGEEGQGFEQPQGLLVAVDFAGEVVQQFESGRLPTGLAVDADGLWMTDCLSGTLTRLDPADGAIVGEPIVVGAAYPPDEPFDWYREDHACPGALARAGDTIWVALQLDGTVVPVR